MRPRGEIREALLEALKEHGSGGAGITIRRIAALKQVGYKAAMVTMGNMVRSGEVERIGSEKLKGTQYWEYLYAIKEPEPEAGVELLASVMRAFPAAIDA